MSSIAFYSFSCAKLFSARKVSNASLVSVIFVSSNFCCVFILVCSVLFYALNSSNEFETKLILPKRMLS